MSVLKRVVSTLVSVLLIAVASATAMAETYFSDGEFEFVKTDKGNGLITACELTDADITVPEFVLGYPIAGIGDYAFMSMPALKSISMPLSVATIGEYAFAENPQSFLVNIPLYCDSIASTAFANSPNVTIVGRKNSYAAQYAFDNDIKFIALDDLILGDANSDGEINIMDVTFIQKYKLGLDGFTFDNKYQFSCADVNHDGTVTIRDATLIQMYLAGIVDSL